ncbi:MAG: TIGR03667 family PPOX class F420-dependent oxidoreductase [Thermomicrobiales bacterium]
MTDLNTAKDGQVAERLASDLIIWLGTVRPDGRPHLVPVWFDWDGETMTIFSQPDNQKIRNLRHEPRVILSLDDTHGGGDVVLFEGEASLMDKPAADAMTDAYVTKYDAQMKQMNMEPVKMAAEYSQVIRIRPTRFMGW